METLFLSVLSMNFTASYVIVLVMIVRALFKDVPKSISFALWSVVGFRLLCPFSFHSMFSLLPSSITPDLQNLFLQQYPQTNVGIDIVDYYANYMLLPSVTNNGTNTLQFYALIGSLIWISVIAGMLTYSILSVLRLKKELSGAKQLEENVYEADNLKTPFILGVLHPKIYIPAGLTAEEKSYIIQHEGTHIRRFDYIIKPLAFLILCIHWFNPLVWIAFFMMNTDMELSCDEKVINEMGSDIKKAYSTSILSFASARRVINGSPLAFGEGNVRKRIENVLNYEKPALRRLIKLVVMAVVIGAGLFANPGWDNIKPADVEKMYFASKGETTEFSTDRVIDENSQKFLLDIVNTAHRAPYLHKEYLPTYDELYRISSTIVIEVKDSYNSDDAVYELLHYGHKDWSFLHGETEQKLALVRSYDDGSEKIWMLLPQRYAIQVRNWIWQTYHGTWGMGYE